jgi:glycosyltransferase involved in cell wall biosynthesis
VYSREILHKYDLFILPTLNENFGHSIVESLSVGTPVLISDNTPWRSSASYAINSVPLLSNSWIEALNFFARLDSKIKYSASQEALSIFDEIAADSDVLNYIEKMEIV